MFTKIDHILGHKENLSKYHNAKINNKILKTSFYLEIKQ